MATEVRKQRLLDEIHACCPPGAGVRPPHVSPACWDLLQRLLTPNAAERITASDALQHEWFQGPPQEEILETPQLKIEDLQVEKIRELRHAIDEGYAPKPLLSGRKCSSGVSTPLKVRECNSRVSSTTASPLSSSRGSLDQDQCASPTF